MESSPNPLVLLAIGPVYSTDGCMHKGVKNWCISCLSSMSVFTVLCSAVHTTSAFKGKWKRTQTCSLSRFMYKRKMRLCTLLKLMYILLQHWADV